MKLIILSILPFLFMWFIQNRKVPEPGDKLLIALQKWHDDNPQEKVFVQTDKDKYLAGEAIWLKAWCTLDNKPSFLSRILYIDITDENGIVVEKKMYQLDMLSSAYGVIDLKQDLKTGYYSLNAYTLWMLNYPAFIFKKNIFVFNSDYKPVANAVKSGNQVIFFPEGGDMVDQIRSRIAFKGVNKTGYPVSFTGSIHSNSGEKITDFQSQHNGMGIFEFTPFANTIYTAKVTFNDGTQASYNLPAAKKEGISLQVQNTSATRIFVLVNRAEFNKARYNNLYVVAQINGIPVYKTNLNIDEGESAASIIKKNLSPGIMQITVFDSSDHPLAERLVFIENYNIVAPEIVIEKKDINKRGRNIYTFRLDSLISPNISALVINSIIEPAFPARDNIASTFLLTSDIKGYIHNPGYYFSNKTTTTLGHLDLLLMTQGWRRFTWNQVKGNETIALKYPVESSLSIKGKVTKSDRADPVTNGYVALLIKGEDSTSILSNAYLTDKGEFIVDSLNFKSKAEVSYQGTNNNKNQLAVDVKIFPAYIDTLKNSKYKPEPQADSNLLLDRGSLADYLQSGLQKLDSTKVKVLQNIEIKGKRLTRADSLQKEYVSSPFENSDQTLIVPEGKSFINIWQFLNSSVPGLNVNPFEPGGVQNVTFGRNFGLTAEGDSQNLYVKFFINEIPVATDIINTLHPDDVALVKIYKGATAFAFGADAGAISIYTKKGVNANLAVFDKRFMKKEKIGYAVTREFYNPNYTQYPDLNKHQKDDRVVLYWTPEIKPSKAGIYTIDFHNSDNTKTFKLIIQGMDSNGKIIYKEQVIR